MLEKLYFWKGGSGGGSSTIKLLLIILLLFVLLAGAGAGYWYYYIYSPEQEQKAAQEAAKAKLQADISSVKNFYQTSLDGMSIPQTLSLFSEINREILPLRLAFVGNGLTYTCDTKKCDFNFDLDNGVVATYPVVKMWGKEYKASPFLPKGKQEVKSGFQYTNVTLALDDNDLLQAYKNKKDLSLLPCGEIVSYVTTYNSYLGKNPKKGGRIKFITFPATTVEVLEKQLGTQVHSYGMRSATWEIEIKGDSNSVTRNMTDMQMLLYKQSYRSAFLIRKIASTDKGIKVSGGLVCKA
ncbi:Flagellar basal body-associated protein FliL [Enterobacteriaceae bacterium strain FGI 57]|jgi:Flagellar basal body-associated protein FliL.|nr:Flagellar basal body-associated protein FliL [Enterobacteriaceae bacterium strain FGI 57]